MPGTTGGYVPRPAGRFADSPGYGGGRNVPRLLVVIAAVGVLASLVAVSLTRGGGTAPPVALDPAIASERQTEIDRLRAAGGELEMRLAAKLEEAWLHKAQWHTDFDAARADAAASGRPIFAYFTRSYAH